MGSGSKSGKKALGLKVTDLEAGVVEEAGKNARQILNGVSLEVPFGEIHVIMGPNGSGKSTFASVLAGSPVYAVTAGSVSYGGTDFTELSPEERVAKGFFLAFQNPVELPGVNNANFLRSSLNAVRRARGEPEMESVAFLKLVREEMQKLSIPPEMLKRGVNVGFSGGEKKRNEVLQMRLLKPGFAILDETDSGLDVDALKIVADGVNSLRTPDFSALVITHHHRLLDYIRPDRVHIMNQGRIVASGGPELAREIEAEGFHRHTQEVS